MQETKTRTPAEDMPSSRPTWIRAVAIVAAVALLGGVLYATWQAVASNDDPEPDAIGRDEPEPDFSLSDAQAIARFHELDEIRVRAYKTADVGMVSNFADQGPFKEQVVDELRTLRREGVIASPTFKTEHLSVSNNTTHRIELRQVVIFDARFFNEDGEDVTDESGRERLTVLWELSSTNHGWLMSESNIVDAESL